MEATDITHETIWQSGDAVNMARVQVAGANAEQADVASITRTIYDLESDTPTTAIATSSLTVADVVYNTLQTTMWSADSVGYNFRDRIAGSNFPNAHLYGIKYAWVGANSEVFVVEFELRAKDVYG